jgi:hypothetical protein
MYAMYINLILNQIPYDMLKYENYRKNTIHILGFISYELYRKRNDMLKICYHFYEVFPNIFLINHSILQKHSLDRKTL